MIGTDGCSKKLKLWLKGRADRSGMLLRGSAQAAAGSQQPGQQPGQHGDQGQGQQPGGGGLRLFFADPRTRCIPTPRPELVWVDLTRP